MNARQRTPKQEGKKGQIKSVAKPADHQRSQAAFSHSATGSGASTLEGAAVAASASAAGPAGASPSGLGRTRPFTGHAMAGVGGGGRKQGGTGGSSQQSVFQHEKPLPPHR